MPTTMALVTDKQPQAAEEVIGQLGYLEKEGERKSAKKQRGRSSRVEDRLAERKREV